jgi:hypothetical protein
MAAYAVRFPRIDAGGAHATMDVSASSYGFKVGRIDAVPDAAQMIEVKPGGNGANQQFIRKPMGSDKPIAFPAERSIATRVLTPSPHPTVIRTTRTVDFAPEANDRVGYFPSPQSFSGAGQRAVHSFADIHFTFFGQERLPALGARSGDGTLLGHLDSSPYPRLRKIAVPWALARRRASLRPHYTKSPMFMRFLSERNLPNIAVKRLQKSVMTFQEVA